MPEVKRKSSALQPPDVKSLDLQRFLGKRHEIALIPKYFQRKRVRETGAEYALGGSGELRAQKRRIAADGSLAPSISATRLVSRDHARRRVESQPLGGVP